MARRILTGLRPQTYEHPADTKALDALQQTRGLETLVRKCNEWGFERLLRVQLTGRNVDDWSGAHYVHHCAAAREIAKEYFDGDRVLPRLLDQVMASA